MVRYDGCAVATTTADAIQSIPIIGDGSQYPLVVQVLSYHSHTREWRQFLHDAAERDDGESEPLRETQDT